MTVYYYVQVFNMSKAQQIEYVGIGHLHFTGLGSNSPEYKKEV